jgi:hypothetical protein
MTASLAWHRRLLLAGFASALVALAAGCSSPASTTTPPAAAPTPAQATSAAGTPVPATSTTPPATPTAGTSPTTPATAATSPATPGTAATSAPTSPSALSSGTSVRGGCVAANLQASPGLSQGTAGTIYYAITLTNVGNTSCTLDGYPGVQLTTGDPGTPIGAPATRDSGETPAIVTLAPQGAANFTLGVVDAANYPTSKCGPEASSYLQVYAPGDYSPIYMAFKVTGCTVSSTHILTASTVTPGNGG